jgi:hypothetical protein
MNKHTTHRGGAVDPECGAKYSLVDFKTFTRYYDSAFSITNGGEIKGREGEGSAEASEAATHVLSLVFRTSFQHVPTPRKLYPDLFASWVLRP